MAAPVYNTTIERGSTFQLTVTYKDASGDVVNLTGWTYRMQVRESQEALTPILTSEGGSATIAIDSTNATTGVLVFSVTPTNTTAISPSTLTTAYYDIEIQKTSTGEVRRILQGKLNISPEITHA
jgi:hypothetical protein